MKLNTWKLMLHTSLLEIDFCKCATKLFERKQKQEWN